MQLNLYVDEETAIAASTSDFDLSVIQLIKEHLAANTDLKLTALCAQVTAAIEAAFQYDGESIHMGQCLYLHYIYALLQLCTTKKLKSEYNATFGLLLHTWGHRGPAYAEFLATVPGSYTFLCACRDYFSTPPPSASTPPLAAKLTCCSHPSNIIGFATAIFEPKALMPWSSATTNIPNIPTLRQQFHLNCRTILHNFAAYQPYDTPVDQLPTIAFGADMDKMAMFEHFADFTPPTDAEAEQKLADLNALVTYAQSHPTKPIITRPSQFSTHPLFQSTTRANNHPTSNGDNNNNINDINVANDKDKSDPPTPQRFADFLSFIGFDTASLRQLSGIVSAWDLIMTFDSECLQTYHPRPRQLELEDLMYDHHNPWNPHRINALLDRLTIITAAENATLDPKLMDKFCNGPSHDFSPPDVDIYTTDELTPFYFDQWGGGLPYQLNSLARRIALTVQLHHPYFKFLGQDFLAYPLHSQGAAGHIRFTYTTNTQRLYMLDKCLRWFDTANLYHLCYNYTRAPPLSLAYHKTLTTPTTSTLAFSRPILSTQPQPAVTQQKSSVVEVKFNFDNQLCGSGNHTFRMFMSRIINESWDNVVVNNNDDGNYLHILLLPYKHTPEDQQHPYTHSTVAFELLLLPFYLFSTVPSVLDPDQTKLEVDGDVVTNCTTLFKYVILMQDFLTSFPPQYSKPPHYAAHKLVDRTLGHDFTQKFFLIYLLFHWVLAHSTFMLPPHTTITTLPPTSTSIMPLDQNRNTKPTAPTAQHLITHLKQQLSTAAITPFFNRRFKYALYMPFFLGDEEMESFVREINANPHHTQKVLQHYNISYPILHPLVDDDDSSDEEDSDEDGGDDDEEQEAEEDNTQTEKPFELDWSTAQGWLYYGKMFATIPLVPASSLAPDDPNAPSTLPGSDVTGIDVATSNMITTSFQTLMVQYNTKLSQLNEDGKKKAQKRRRKEKPQPTDLHEWCSYTIRTLVDNTDADNLINLMRQLELDAKTPTREKWTECDHQFCTRISDFVQTLFVLSGILKSIKSD